MVKISNFDNAYTLNNTNANLFSRKIFKILDNVTNKFLSKNADKLQKKDRSVLNDIVQQQLNRRAVGGITRELNSLWDVSFRLGEKSTKKSNFTLTDHILESNSLAEFAPSRADIQDVQRKTDIQNSLVGEAISDTEFGNDYLRYRNREVARNYTDVYTNKLFSSVEKYMNSDRRYNNTEELLLDLGIRTPNEMNDYERKIYDRWFKKTYGGDLAGIPSVYGLSKEVIKNDSRFNDAYYWKYDLQGRIRRIARTEANAAFNLGRINVYLEQGYTEFTWQTDKEEVCVLCTSKEGDIVTMRDLAISVANYDQIGWTDFSKIYTEEDKDSYGVTPSGRSYDNTTAVFPPLHSFCGCALIPREEGRRDKLAVTTEKVLNRTQRIAISALSLFKKTAAVGSVVGFGAVTLGEEYVRKAKEVEEREKKDIMTAVIGASSLLAGGFLMFKFMQKHPQFVTTARNLGMKIGKSILKSEIKKQKLSAIGKYREARRRNVVDIIVGEEAEENKPNETTAYIDFSNLGLSPVLSAQLIKELGIAKNKANYHDLVATKLREYLFDKLSPMQMNILSDIENVGKQAKFWENNFGKDAESIINITATIQNHLELAKATGKSNIISIKPPANVSRFKYFMQPSLQDIAVGGKYVFKNVSLPVNNSSVIKLMTKLRNDLGRDIDWDIDKQEILRRISNTYITNDKNAENIYDSIKKVFPNTRSGLPTGSNLMLQTEKLHPISIPNINTREKISGFSERLSSLKANLDISPSAIDTLEADILNYQEEVTKWGTKKAKKDLDNVLLELGEVRGNRPLEIAEREKLLIKIENKQQIKKKALAIDTEDRPTVSERKVLDVNYESKLSAKNLNRRREQIKYESSVNNLNNIEKELDDIARSWYDPSTITEVNYLSSSRSFKRSEAVNRQLINIHGKLEREKKVMKGNSYITDRIDDILKNKLNIVETTSRGKKVKGSNDLFPERLEGVGLQIAREKTKLSEQYKVIEDTAKKVQNLTRTRFTADTRITNNIIDSIESQLKNHYKNLEGGIKTEKIRLRSVMEVNNQKIKNIKDRHKTTKDQIKKEISKKIKSITTTEKIRDDKKIQLVEILTKLREESMSSLNSSAEISIKAINNYNEEITNLIKNKQ